MTDVMKTENVADPTPSIKQHIAVKAIIKNRAGSVLVLKQSDEAAVQGAGFYHPPGGIVELGESLGAALAREVLEETGLTVDVTGLLAVEEWQATIRGQQCYFVGIFYGCRVVGGELVVDSEENADGRWVGRDDLTSISILQPSKKVIENLLNVSPA
jgi:8-oxo-dGTP diphosphatase